ncbi:MAG: hypothetical protein U0892_11180 [Pirellulales bacterium]
MGNSCPPAQAAEPPESEDLAFLDNGRIRVGMKRSSGGAIAWVSASGSDRNLVNAFDRGRLIQQSYYGRPDGSMWNKQPWTWNPVQGGDWRGSPARVLQFDIRDPRKEAYVKSVPKHWASGEELDKCGMEQTIELRGNTARVRYHFRQRGGEDHPKRDQELPAVFVRPDLETFVVYTGDRPWSDEAPERSRPGWPNEGRKMTEHWAAYVDAEDNGLGVYVPAADRLTCYRYGKSSQAKDACSYFAPIKQLSITADFDWDYEIVIAIGKSDAIRETFREEAKSSKQP